MIYRKHGKTNTELSIIAFGGMRFKEIDNRDLCVEMMVEAAQSGINYFDTAPLYFSIKGEQIFGEGFNELKRRNLPFYSSTKTFASSESAIRKELDQQLKRLNLDHIDFYHMWNVSALEKWQTRKNDGIIEAFLKLKEEGLIKNICVSSHLIGNQIEKLLQENIFDAVLFGYSAYNFTARQAAFNVIKKYDIGCIVMNPLGGGIIPQHPELFNHLKTYEKQSVIEAALHFIFNQEKITAALVGFSSIDEVRQAVKAVDNYKKNSDEKIEEIKAKVQNSFNDLCTSCQYCDNCPAEIPIPKYMDAYNHKILYGNDNKQILERLKMHWFIPADWAQRCTECGQCEEICTQHLPIIDRLKEIAALKK
jgi:predicted aldo/keto reductase-like oxidoreductase